MKEKALVTLAVAVAAIGSGYALVHHHNEVLYQQHLAIVAHDKAVAAQKAAAAKAAALAKQQQAEAKAKALAAAKAKATTYYRTVK